MKAFNSFLIFELRRSSTWLNVTVLTLYFVFSLYVVHRGVDQYNEIKETKVKFQQIERLKVEQWNNYTQYGGYGFRLYFMPSALSIFFNNTNLFNSVTAHIDVGEELNIYKSFKGKEVFVQKSGNWLDFSGLILLFGSLMALFYGHDALKQREFLKFLVRLYGRKQVFSFIPLARLILLCGYFLMVNGCALLLLKIRGITLTSSDLNNFLAFMVLMLVLLAFFFTLGTVAGSIKSKFKGLLIIFVWFGFVYLCPVFISTLIEEKTSDLPINYKSELRKLTTLMDYEDQVNLKSQFLGEIFRKISSEKPGTLEELEGFLKKQEEIIQNEAAAVEILKYLTKSWTLEALKASLIKQAEILGDLTKILNKEFENKEPGRFEISSVLSMLREKVIEKMMRTFEREEFPKIQVEEVDITKEMFSNIKYQQYLAGIFPSTFYLEVNNEISSRGYQGILEFHKYAKKVKDEFFKFYNPRKRAELKAQARGKRIKVESFFDVRNDLPNVFEGKSHIPAFFFVGLLITLAWLLGALLLSYYLYKKSLFQSPKEEVVGLEDMEIDLNKGESNVVLANKKITVSNHLYNVLSGKNRGFKGKVLVKGIDLATKKKEIGFVYLCHPDQIPVEIRVKNFFSFICSTLKLAPDQITRLRTELNIIGLNRKNFGELREKDRGKILLETALLKNSDIYVFHDFVKGMPTDFVREFMERLQQLKESGATILYVTNDGSLGQKIGDYVLVSKEDAGVIIKSCG